MKKISRRDFLKASGLVAATGALAACGSTSSSTAASTPASTAGAGTDQQGGEILIGCLQDITGATSVFVVTDFPGKGGEDGQTLPPDTDTEWTVPTVGNGE